MTTAYATKVQKKPASLASEKQIAFIAKLSAERQNGALYVQTQLATYKIDSVPELTKKAASNIIGVLLNEPYAKKAEVAPAAEVEAGIYKVGEDVVKVQVAVHGSGKPYAKVLKVHEVKKYCGGCEQCDGENTCNPVIKKKGTFEYAPGMIKNVTPAHKMDLAAAIEFGAVYGVCCQCGRTLTDEKSIEAGIGPVCGKKF